jgi:hypothetical protein
MEAEMLCRKSLRIREELHGPASSRIVNSSIHLSNILQRIGNHDDERKKLLEQCLAIKIRRLGIDIVEINSIQYLSISGIDIVEVNCISSDNILEILLSIVQLSMNSSE